MSISKDWEFVKVVTDGEPFFINGVGIWENEWKNTDQSIYILDPVYHRPYTLPIYEISADGKTITFAATEFSNCVWGVYIPVASHYVIGYIH
ncbi:hypothetical protein [Pedobacter chitinilyticus]|uniref:Uncharacterized protein n=1 Tax=Pedobacter chitinilyticus TaxID=2233776 RepID=A0A3S3R4S0_9SPHI|nr:hypothetical protein [Pedobacter chitinilyticus]RWU05006.1 hypothetical protein DPV69_17745 [Pedobacter chitinilyticus]